MQKTAIEYSEYSWNFIGGCSPVSDGCKNCWAARLASGRLKNHPLYKGLAKNGKWTGEIHPYPERVKPIGGKPKRIFVQPMGDLFHEHVPFAFIAKVIKTISLCPQHVYLILTKRIKRAVEFCSYQNIKTLPENICFGVTVENDTFLWRITELLTIPASIYFVSHEPVLGPITYPKKFLALGSRAWIIAGGESGPKARPMHPDWPRYDRNQAITAGIPFFFKQWGEWTSEYPQSLSLSHRKQTCENKIVFYCTGKNKAGRLLDGKEWNQYPKIIKRKPTRINI